MKTFSAHPGLTEAHRCLFVIEVVQPLLVAAGYIVENARRDVLVERIEVNRSPCWEYSVRLSAPANRPRVDALVFRSIKIGSIGAKWFIEDVVSQALEYLHATDPGATQGRRTTEPQ